MKTDENESANLITQIVNFVLPEITPYELSFYLFLLGKSFETKQKDVRVGKRTIAYNCGKGTRSDKANFQHVTKILKSLEEKGCIRIGDTKIRGTLYSVNTPTEIPFAAEKIALAGQKDPGDDYFNIPERRRELFERDNWVCFYCGEKVTPEDVTLDHLIPQSKGGQHTKENLKTCCFTCNSIKSGKTFEEAAPLILKNIRERKVKAHK